MSSFTLITGANGYVGERVAAKLLDRTDTPVTLWVHAVNEAEATEKTASLRAHFAPYGGRVEYAWGELRDEAPFASVDTSRVRGIVHAAAVTRFNVDRDTADIVNTGGAERAFQFASSCPSLEEFTYVSTVYASGLAAGIVSEELFDDGSGFANHYERSKFESERLLTTRYDALPWRIARVATIIADDESGHVTQYNAVHNTLKLFFYGLMSLVPGREATPLYFVTGEFVASALADVILAGAPHTAYNLVHSRAETLSLDDLITIAFETFAENEDFRSRRILKPLYADSESFDILVDGLDSFGGDALRQALGSVAPFARQLFIDKDFRNDHTRGVVRDYRAPEPQTLVRATCKELVRTRWGKKA